MVHLCAFDLMDSYTEPPLDTATTPGNIQAP